MDHILVVGASVGGIHTLAGLRTAGFRGTITLVDPEAANPYDRPPLSKQVLMGTWTPERASLGDPVARWDARIVAEPAAGLDATAHEVVLASGRRLGYDALVIATGASPRQLPGARYSGVHVLRSMSDCLALRRSLASGGPLVVVGGGFIGAEVASSARAQGIPVTIVETLPTPMYQILGPAAGATLASLHERNGVDLRCGTAVRELVGDDDRVRAVALADGTLLRADTILVGIGVAPNTSWLANSGIHVDDGVVCDEYCAANGVPDVYAVGDVARWYDQVAGDHIRVEHWTNTTAQATTVAGNLVHSDQRQAYVSRPYFWSDQHGVKIQLVGHPVPDSTATVVRQGTRTERIAVIYHDGDQLRAGLTINWPRALVALRFALDNQVAAHDLLTQLDGLAAAPGHRQVSMTRT